MYVVNRDKCFMKWRRLILERKFTSEEFEKITELKIQIENCFSYKEAKPYISKLDAIRNRYSGKVGYKMAELISCLTEFCKRNADKEHWKTFVEQDYFILNEFVEK